MFSIVPEIKKIPEWFQNFEVQKLYAHPVKAIQVLIYLMQGGLMLGFCFSFYLMAKFNTIGAFMNPYAMVGLATFCFSIALVQVMILGLHARSPLAWLLIMAASIQYLFTALFPVGLGLLILMESKAVQNYFRETV